MTIRSARKLGLATAGLATALMTILVPSSLLAQEPPATDSVISLSELIVSATRSAAAVGRLAAGARRRHTVRIANPAGRSAMHGMFTGCGAIRGGVEFTQSNLNDNNIGGVASVTIMENISTVPSTDTSPIL